MPVTRSFSSTVKIPKEEACSRCVECSAMVKAMNETGFGVFSFDHEGGDAQFEFDFDYAPALEMADKITFFRLMAKHVARTIGMLI